MLFAIGGAAIETAFSGAYNIAQQFGWEWGKLRLPRRRRASRSPGWRCSRSRTLVVQTGVDPVVVTEYSVIFSVVALPLTYVPILLVANDPAYMQRPRERAGSPTCSRSSTSSSSWWLP